ncbi:MAG: dihydroorotate dehydrogenase [Acidimicrobiia bacterium]|jgi:dihydroorotate dehydrogenase (NAD+) catalytic subunit
MARPGLKTQLGPLELRSPLIAASGTVGSVWEWADVADVEVYGAAVAKSVSPLPWEGRPAPRVAPTEAGMLNGIGIQNPGIERWVEEMTPRIERLGVPVWGSSVAHEAEGFAKVSHALEAAGVEAIEVNLSCPNLDDGIMFSFDERLAGEVVSAVRDTVSLPIGAKLSPNTPELVPVASATRDAGADFIILTNTAFGYGVDIDTERPLLSGGVGGYSGVGLKPISIRCVREVSAALPDYPVVGCGGVFTGRDVLEYMMAGASAVEAGTVHLAEPRAGVRIVREMRSEMNRLGFSEVGEVVGRLGTW